MLRTSVSFLGFLWFFPKFLSPFWTHRRLFLPGPVPRSRLASQAYVEGVHAASWALVINALLMTLTTYAIPKVESCGGALRWVPGGLKILALGWSSFFWQTQKRGGMIWWVSRTTWEGSMWMHVDIIGDSPTKTSRPNWLVDDQMYESWRSNNWSLEAKLGLEEAQQGVFSLEKFGETLQSLPSHQWTFFNPATFIKQPSFSTSLDS